MPARAALDRATIVEAAASLLDEKRHGGVTLSELAATLGVRPPSLYNHINGMSDLQREIALYGTRELGSRIGRAAIGKSGPQAVIAIGQAYRSFAKDRPGLYLAILSAPTDGEDARAAVSNEILDILRRVLDPFCFAADNEVHAMRALRSLLHGFASLELNEGFGIPIDVDQSFEYLMDMIIVGLQQVNGTT